MTEREMQELLWRYPERLLNEPLKPYAWETSSPVVGRADLVFEDRHSRFLIVEVKRGTLPRGAIDQLLDYFGMMKARFPEKAVELMVVANTIPPERKLICQNYNIECREISEKTFRDLAAEVGYSFASEANTSDRLSQTPVLPSSGKFKNRIESPKWSYDRTGRSNGSRTDGNEQEFLSRCDAEGKVFFAALFEAHKTATHQSRITWDHESGFSLQFYFHSLGYAPVMWGFPATNRNGKAIRERLNFPFDFALRVGVPEAFINEFGGALSSVVPFSGGGRRPNIPIQAIAPSSTTEVIDKILAFAAKASQK
jgi:hypothetical protein